MFYKNNFLFSILFCFIICTGCRSKTSVEKDVEEVGSKIELKYAKGFEIVHFKNYKRLIIKVPYPNAKEAFEYILTPSSDLGVIGNQIKTPVQSVVVTSTTHVPMLELLGVEDRLIGFQNNDYISSEKTRMRIEQGFVKELGTSSALNTEVLLELNPNVVVGFAMTKTNKAYNFIEQQGIPVVINGDWLEETPLGRAEWIKFFGVLFNKEEKANQIFNSIESDYFTAVEIAKQSKQQFSVLSGAIMRNEVWNLPAGESFVAQFLKDANLDYLWKDTEGKGSLNLGFEHVFEKGQNADFWIAPGYFSTKQQMLDANAHYANFSSFKKGNVYTPSTKTGKTGGVIFFELAPTRPDLVLKDLIKMTNPKLLPEYEMTFFEKMN